MRTFFVDEDLAGVGLRLRDLRPPQSQVIVASHPPTGDKVPRDDPDWIPYVAQLGWVVITNDKRIRTRPTEAPRAIEFGLRCAHLYAGRDAPVWDFVRLLLRHWDAVVALTEGPGPVWLQLDHRRSTPFEREYRPGEPPRLPADKREGRARAARRPSRSLAATPPRQPTNPDQDPLPF